MSYIQQQEDDEYEASARYDYIKEAYAGMVECPKALAAEERYWAELDAIAAQDEMEARGGPPARWFPDEAELPF